MARGPLWTKAEERNLRSLARLAITKSEAARRLGRHPSTIVRKVQQLGIKWRPRPPARKTASLVTRVVRPWSDEEDARLQVLSAQGWRIGHAAVELDRPEGTVLKHSRRLGLRWRGQFGSGDAAGGRRSYVSGRPRTDRPRTRH